MKQKLFSVWEGVYSSFEDAGGDLEAFNTKIWLNKQIDNILKREASLNSRNSVPIPDSAISKDYPLALMIAILLGSYENISVLDFGGGMGAGYFELIEKVPNILDKLNYFIVENEATIQSIPIQLKKYNRLSFYKSNKDVVGDIDIVHIGSCLQYCSDWRGTLEALDKQSQPQYFVFSDLLAGHIRSFVSHQIFYDKKIPHWFLSYDDIVSEMNRLDYELQYHSYYVHKILNQEEIFPNFGLPEECRIDRAMNLVFKRKGGPF